jgi:membrane protein required for beta-lactamase induction
MAHENLFAVVFWFVLLGPAGALLYHSLSVYQQYSKRYNSELLGWEPAIHWTHYAAGWIPARLTALFFGLVGNFETGFHCWRKMALDSESLVVACAEASLKDQGGDKHDPSMLAFTLVERASFIWLIVLAVISFNI